MTNSEHKVCLCAIREMRILCDYHRLIGLRELGQRFPTAFCEAIEEVLKRFEERLEKANQFHLRFPWMHPRVIRSKHP